MLFRIAHTSDGLLDDAGEAQRKHRYFRPKENIEPRWLCVLAALAIMPLILILARSMAMPGAYSSAPFGLGFLHSLGAALNQSLTLEWVPPLDRAEIYYLLLLPLGAVFVCLARLTLGLRILGFRAILLAIGFQEVGILPGLLLIAVVVGIIAAIRPSMRKIRLPLFARVSVVLCTTATVMVAALMIAPIIRSEVMWGVAFFPVIIVAMFAEGIAKTLAQDDLVTATWRASWTIIVALLFAVVSMIPAVRYSIIQFPELILTQLISIIFISEFLDLRLMDHWPKSIKRYLDGVRPWWRAKPRIAVIRNRWNRNVIGRLGDSTSTKYKKRSVQKIVTALRSCGFRVKVFEADLSLPSSLRKFLPPNQISGRPGGLVFNLGSGTQGNGQFVQVPALLELAGVAYTGPDPLAQATLQDRFAMLTTLKSAGVRVADFRLAVAPGKSWDISKIEYPVMVRSRYPSKIKSRKVRSEKDLIAAVNRLEKQCPQSALVEACVSGTDLRVSIIGNESLECLPIVERDKNGAKICPASLSDKKANAVRETAMRVYHIIGCRDYARIDLRMPKGARLPVVKRVVWDNVLAKRGSLLRSAEVAEYSFTHLMYRIVEEALLRYGLRADLSQDAERVDLEAELSTIDDDKRIVAS